MAVSKYVVYAHDQVWIDYIREVCEVLRYVCIYRAAALATGYKVATLNVRDAVILPIQVVFNRHVDGNDKLVSKFNIIIIEFYLIIKTHIYLIYFTNKIRKNMLIIILYIV